MKTSSGAIPATSQLPVGVNRRMSEVPARAFLLAYITSRSQALPGSFRRQIGHGAAACGRFLLVVAHEHEA
jgi:hypothetical protein